jgi:hypothetical protein
VIGGDTGTELVPFTCEEIDALDLELGPGYGPLAVFVAETGLVVTRCPKTERSRRRVPLTTRPLVRAYGSDVGRSVTFRPDKPRRRICGDTSGGAQTSMDKGVAADL